MTWCAINLHNCNNVNTVPLHILGFVDLYSQHFKIAFQMTSDLFNHFNDNLLHFVDEPAICDQASELEKIQTARLVLDSEPIKGSCS